MTFDEALQYATERARECLLEINNNNLNDFVDCHQISPDLDELEHINYK